MTIITRFAPSPTGNLHIGGLRTALFNFLYTRHFNGKFYLRIEDTDKKRSSDEFLVSIFDGVKWIGINFDDIIYQSKKEERHREVANLLYEKGLAYKSDGAIRLKVEEDKKFVFNDLILGEICADSKQIEDVVILRSDGSPTYMLAVVVDDYDMGINHIIRGSDHITNTFKQIIIYHALGWNVPNFAHIPLIHNKSGGKLSKRDGAANVIDFKDLGILPEAFLNYILRLGWSHGNKEIFSMQEAIELFDLSSVGKSPACFNIEKLYSLNSHYIKTLPTQRIFDELVNFLGDVKIPDKAMIESGIEIFKPRVKSLTDLANSLNFYFHNIKPESDVNKQLLQNLRLVLLEANYNDNLATIIKSYINESVYEIKDVYKNLRLAIVGRENSPPIIDILLSLGKDISIAKIDYVLSEQQ